MRTHQVCASMPAHDPCPVRVGVQGRVLWLAANCCRIEQDLRHARYYQTQRSVQVQRVADAVQVHLTTEDNSQETHMGRLLLSDLKQHGNVCLSLTGHCKEYPMYFRLDMLSDAADVLQRMVTLPLRPSVPCIWPLPETTGPSTPLHQSWHTLY